MLNRTLISCLLIWLTPVIFGVLGAAYKIVLFRNIGFNPELEPDYIWYATTSLYFIGGVVGFWLIARSLKLGARTVFLRVAFSVTLVFVFVYIFIRSVTVESALVSKYAYCCCCEDVPTISETYIRILSPIKF